MTKSILVSAYFIVALSPPIFAGWLKDLVELGTVGYEATQDYAKDIARSANILNDMNSIQDEQNESIQEIYKLYRRAGEGDIFKDAIDDIYTYDMKKKKRNISELSEIGERLNISKDYVKSAEKNIQKAFLEFYNGPEEMDDSTKFNLEKSRKDRGLASELNETGREQLLIKQNAQQYETQQQLLDYTKKMAKYANESNALNKLKFNKKVKEDREVQDAFFNETPTKNSMSGIQSFFMFFR